MAKLLYIHYSIDSVQYKNCISSWVASVTWHVSYLSNIVFIVISIYNNWLYSVQLRYKANDRLIHFTVCAACTASVARHFKQYYIRTIALVPYTHVIRRLTSGITVMCITHGFMVGLGNNGFTNPIISSSCLEISSAYNPLSSRFPFPLSWYLQG